MSDSEEPLEPIDEGGDDLFGDDDGNDDVQSDGGHALSDRELASDPELEEPTTTRYDDVEEAEVRRKVIAPIQMYRHRVPKPSDGTLHSLRIPQFVKFNPVEYKRETWEPTEWDTENEKLMFPKPVVRFRRDAATGKMQSNAVFYRWSDGSVTLAVGDEQYRVVKKSLAPPANKPYQELQDAHYYAAAAHLSSNSLLVVGHVTEQYSVLPNQNVQDDALEILTKKLEAEKQAQKHDMIVTTTEDPELQKKQAELAEKERARAQRRRETAAARMEGVGGGRSRVGLSVSDLEGGRRGPGGGGRKRGAPGQNKIKRRRPEYDSDDDLAPGDRRGDNYDLEDGFLVPSDEEEEVEDDDDEEDILDDDDDDDEAPRSKRHKTADADEDADGEADLDDVDAPAQEITARGGRRRNVVVDDDEE